MLEIDIDSRCGILFIRLFGSLTKKTRGKLNKEVFNLLIDAGVKNVVLNLENLHEIDDSGFKTLKKCYNVCANDGNAMICLSKDLKYDFSMFNMVSDELKAMHIINA